MRADLAHQEIEDTSMYRCSPACGSPLHSPNTAIRRVYRVVGNRVSMVRALLENGLE